MRLFVLLLFGVQLLTAETFAVVHRKDAWPDGKGNLHITEEGIRFEAEKAKYSRDWKWTDIQYFDRISEKEINILTYHDQKRYLGRDRSYRFLLTEGEMTDVLLERVARGLGRPLTDRVVREPATASYEIPVKHQHSFGGCEGKLRFTGDAIQYVTEHSKDAREWRLDRDVDSVWSADPYHLEVHTYDNNRREFSRTRIYKFDLKDALDVEYYRALKRRLINGPSTSPSA
jgi:hypothetical protein